MTDTKKERIAKNILGLFLDIWCDRESDDEPYFNCKKCEFETEYGECLVKCFIHEVKYEIDFPDGEIAIEGGDDE